MAKIMYCTVQVNLMVSAEYVSVYTELYQKNFEIF